MKVTIVLTSGMPLSVKFCGIAGDCTRNQQNFCFTSSFGLATASGLFLDDRPLQVLCCWNLDVVQPSRTGVLDAVGAGEEKPAISTLLSPLDWNNQGRHLCGNNTCCS